MIDYILFMHFSLDLRISSSSRNEKWRRELLNHQRTANLALYLEKPHITPSSVQLGCNKANTIPTFRILSSKPFLTQFFSTKSKTKWKIAEVKWAQSSQVYEGNSTLGCWCSLCHTRNNKRKYHFSPTGYRLGAAQIKHTYHEKQRQSSR